MSRETVKHEGKIKIVSEKQKQNVPVYLRPTPLQVTLNDLLLILGSTGLRRKKEHREIKW